MLPPFIIEQIRKRETEERTQRDQPHLELPLEPRRPPGPPVREEKPERGVTIIDL